MKKKRRLGVVIFKKKKKNGGTVEDIGLCLGTHISMNMEWINRNQRGHEHILNNFERTQAIVKKHLSSWGKQKLQQVDTTQIAKK